MPIPPHPDHPAGENARAPAADEPTRHASAAEEPTRASDGTSARAAPPELEDAVIEGYELREEIHRGGQGVVYRAMQLGTKRQVALKVLLEGPFASEAARRRFEREVELAASLRHPNVVTILDSGVSYGRYYFAMEYIDGLRLDRYLAQVRPALKDTLHLFASICDAVNFAHQRGVIHRDLKPPNILVDEDGQPHVLDFGLAKPIRRAEADQPTVQIVSAAGELLGTVAYMSPEQTVGARDTDLRSDVYSLGVVFYEALLGELPYSVDGPLGEVLTRIANADPQPPRTLRRRSRFGRLVDDELGTILLKTLEKHPARRYQTAGDLARDFRHLLSGEPIEAKRASGLYMLRKTLKRYRVQASVAAAVLLAMVVFLVALAFLWTSQRDATQRADQHRTEALQAAINARQARDELKRALIQQTIQRGGLAQAAGDLVAARDFYWDAYEDSIAADLRSPAALWALRQYYLQTGDTGAAVLHFGSQGPSALSPDGRVAAVCETPTAVTVREVTSGRTVAWLPAPGPVTVLNVDDQGAVCAAGRGWARLWPAGAIVPAIAAQLPSDFEVVSVQAVSAGGRLLLVGPKRLVCFEGTDGKAVGTAKLLGSPTGSADYSPWFEQLAVATAVDVQLVSIGEDGRLRSERSASPLAGPRIVRFSGQDLLALTTDAVYWTSAGGFGPRPWVRLAATPPDWKLFDFRREAGALVFALRNGWVRLFRRGELEKEWRVTVGGLQDVRLTADGEAVITVDQRGTVTRWTPPQRQQDERRIIDGPPVAAALAEDGSSVLLINDRHRVYAYSSQRPTGPRQIDNLVRINLLSGRRPAETLLAVSSQGSRTVVCAGGNIRLRDTRTRTTCYPVWDDAHFQLLKHVALTGDGRVLALCAQTPLGDQQLVSFWQWEPGEQTRGRGPLAELLRPAREAARLEGSLIRCAAFKPRTARLLVARANGDLLWVDATGAGASRSAPEPWVHLDSPVITMAFDRRGEYLAVACADGFLRVLATPDGTVRTQLRIGQPVKTLSFDPHGDVLLVCTADGAVALYELASAQRVAQLAPPREGQPAFATWIGNRDTLLLGDARGVYEHRYHDIDELIAQNRSYAQQRAVARYLTDGNFEAAWDVSAGRRRFGGELARSVQETTVAAALRRARQAVPPTWIEAVLTDAPARTFVHLGHAAYAGERFELAGLWLRQGRELAGGNVDAYTALRLAQCVYLTGDYEQAAPQFAALLDRPDLDPTHIPTVQLQCAAALALADRLDEAKAVARRIGTLESPWIDGVAARSAREITRALTGVESVRPEAALVEQLANQLAGFTEAEASLRFQNDGHFFAGELARQRGDGREALAEYRRCIELARDVWPANWARYRLLQLSGGPP